MTNRDRPASAMTKREHAALELYAHNHEMTAGAAVRCADALFDELDTPTELRDSDDVYYDQDIPNNIVVNHDAIDELRKLAAEIAGARHD